MIILTKIEDAIKDFNQINNTQYDIDTIRVNFSKQHKLEQLKNIGEWSKITINSNIYKKLTKIEERKNKSDSVNIINAYRLERYDIFFYNIKDKTGQYRNAELTIFGLKQYHKKPPPRGIIDDILSVLKNVSCIDVCCDITHKPNISKIEEVFELKRYVERRSKKPTDTYYINHTKNIGIEKVVIYDKGLKNSLGYILHRIEAKISITSYDYLYIQLYEFKEIVDLATSK